MVWHNMQVRKILIAGCVGLLAVLLAGCGGLGKSLESRAADYYNFMAGHSPGKKLSTFTSPARKRDFDKESLARLNELGRGKAVEGTQEADTSQVKVVELDGFAYTLIDPALGAPFRGMKPKRWVRDGRQWYIYEGSDTEVAAYGKFPAGLGVPDWAELLAAEKEAEEAAAADAASSIDSEDSTDPAPDA